jgi:hypothetical protein
MPDQKFALEADGPKRLGIWWNSYFGKRTITLDGREIGEIANARELSKGKTFLLPDGSSVLIRQVTRWGIAELEVLRDGKPMPGSDGDAAKRLSNAVKTIYFIGGLNIVVGGYLYLSSDYFVLNLDGAAAAITGLIYVVLGHFVQKRSMIALGLTVIGFLIDSIGIMLLGAYSPTFMLRWFLLIPMLHGFGAIWALQKSDPANPKASPKPTQSPSKYKSFLDETTLKPQGAKTLIAAEYSRQQLVEMVAIGLVVTLIIGILLGVALTRQNQPVVAVVPTQVASSPLITTPTSNRAPVLIATRIPTQPPWPTSSPMPTIIYPKSQDDYPLLKLNLSPQEPLPTINLAHEPAAAPLYPGDMAWNKPTFAMTYYADGFPSRPTSGVVSGWRTASSDGTWFYVDLGSPQPIHQIIVTHFVDANFSNAPVYYYITSDDLKTWQVVLHEIDTANSTNRFKPNILTLEEDVQARYVGLFAADWGGGWAGIDFFAVFPPEYDYTLEELAALGA